MLMIMAVLVLPNCCRRIRFRKWRTVRCKCCLKLIFSLWFIIYFLVVMQISLNFNRALDWNISHNASQKYHRVLFKITEFIQYIIIIYKSFTGEDPAEHLYRNLQFGLSDPYFYMKMMKWKPNSTTDLLPNGVTNELVILWPTGQNGSSEGYASLLPGQDTYEDRILRQLNYIPRGYTENSPIKYIYRFSDTEWVPYGQEKFIQDQCKVNRCSVSDNINTADAILFTSVPDRGKPPGQIWIWIQLESPYNSLPGFNSLGTVNWTATYRLDSVLVAPYYKFVYNTSVERIPTKDYSKGKTKQVAWFVSNCDSSSGRLQYTEELAKHIEVDIYGGCGNKHCDRNSEECHKMLDQEYRFYLAFENSLCKDYITEKFFSHCLEHNIVPIVRGARKSDYIASAPYNSFIFADDFKSPADLAHYLKNMDEDQYNSYFTWRQKGEMLNTKFWCRMCTMLHASSEPDAPQVWVNDVNNWWGGKGICVYK